MKLDLYRLEECAKDRNEGIDVGRREERASSVKHAQTLIDAGKVHEIANVPADEGHRDALMLELE